MKRCRFGLAVLAGILVLGLFSGACLEKYCLSASRELALAAQSPEPEEILDSICRQWQDRQLLLSILCDHATLEAIEEQFQALDPDSENFREACLRLAVRFRALGGSQRVSWENVF